MIVLLASFSLLTASTGALASPPHEAKVVLIGIDGVSLNLLEPMIEKGVTPNLGKLHKEGARGHFPSIWPLRTPQVWTSVVTGKLPGQHGIWDNHSHTYFNPPEVRTKQAKLVTSADRRSKALWQILGDAGMRTLTVGWVASWPAEDVKNGVMVAPIELKGDRRQTTIKGSFYSDAPRMVSPARLEPKVRKLIVDPDGVSPEEIAQFADVPPAGSPLYSLPYLERYVYALRWSLARAKSVEALTLGLLPEAKPDVVLSYFQCPDSLLHRFWVFHKSPEFIEDRLKTHGIPHQHAAELHKRFGKVVEACYRDVDQRVGRILEQTRGTNTLVMVVSDHGFGHAPVPHKMKDEPYSGDHLDDGVILAAGPGITAGTWLEEAEVLDVTPTLLHWLGQPMGKDMGGKVIAPIFAAGKSTPKMIPSYETTPQTDIAHPNGWPPRKKPRRSAADQMAKR